jgi:sigma-B regulation protein RsbU (phosphoserine phosphatase)
MFRSVRTRMIAFVVVPTALIYVGVLGATMAHLRQSARRDVEREMTRLAAHHASGFDAAFSAASAPAIANARFAQIHPDLTEAQIAELLRAALAQDPAVYGAAMAFEPGTYRGPDELFCPYVHRGPGGPVEMNITRDVYDWYSDDRWEWWHLPRRTGRGAWTDPYFDDGAGNVLMVTYSEPFVRDGLFRGVATADVMLPDLRERIGREIVADLDFVILTARGQYVYSPRPEAIMADSVFDVAEELGRPDLVEVARRVLAGGAGVIAVDGWDSPGRQWVFFAPIRSTGWVFAARVPQRQALAGVTSRMRKAAIALAATLALIVGAVWHVSGRVARPIERLRAKVIEIAAGDLDARVEGIDGDDEVAHLARSFNGMTAELRSHVERLAQERAIRERIERDMDLAREIQRGLLPREAPRVSGFEVAGWNQAADKTGGDYFDWLQFPDGRTILTLADVTGHGIGPALIVAVCRAYMRAATAGGSVDLPRALDRVNDLLHEDIPPGRFVTAAVGILDPARSVMSLVSAGQGPILFYEAATGALKDWQADELPLGIAGGVRYPAPREIPFAPGDVLVMTTDGYFEWPNRSGERFGTRRLGEFVRRNHGLSPADLIEALDRAVREHADGSPQEDDLTAVVVKRV